MVSVMCGNKSNSKRCMNMYESLLETQQLACSLREIARPGIDRVVTTQMKCIPVL
jgi:hypothetical protein